jgi:soluble lytic murein transglycosylase-like protein
VPETARALGLRVDARRDERCDVVRATRAALGYLAAMRARFGSWGLALLAYDLGPTALDRAMRAAGSRDPARLDLAPEYRYYVAKVAAAALLLRNRARFGHAQGEGLR